MHYRFPRAAGLLFILAGMTFWLGWALMPDAGTNDAVHILQLVSQHRAGVWNSVLLHFVSSLLFVVAVVGLQTDSRSARSKTMRVGASLVLLGAMGVSLDAFFHLMAFYMTAPGVTLTEMTVPMQLLQTQGIRFLIPLLVALIVGGTVYSAGCYHIDATSPWSKRVFLLGLAWALFGGLIASGTGAGRPIVVQGFLAIVSIAYCWMGYELLFRFRPAKSPPQI